MKKNNINIKFEAKDLFNYFLIFFSTLVLFRIILPYGDEPDYVHKYGLYLFNFGGFNIFDTSDWSQALTCNKGYLVGDLLDTFMRIAPYFCNNKAEDFAERILIGFIINILYFSFVFLMLKNPKILKILKIKSQTNNTNMHLFFCCLLYPSINYHLGLRSNEVFLFYIILLFFFTWQNYFVSISLSLIAALIDPGNAVVFIIFILYFYMTRFLISKFKLKYILLSNLSLIVLIFFNHENLREFVAILLENSGILYFQNISTHVIKDEQLYLTSSFLKLIITYFSFIFLTPGFVKSTILFIFISIIFVYSFLFILGIANKKKLLRLERDKNYNDTLINALICILYIVIMVFSLPSHSFIRYYIFVYPFIFSLLLYIFNLRIIFLISIYSIFFISFETIIFRIIYFL
tara:strand:- start:6900 stop:8114 length:1215 start_codon:yes stop_codon:yes gene_type:complete